jgi:hypothetical protein
MAGTATVFPLRAALEQLVTLRDPEGVLSVYVDVDAERERRHRPREGEVVLRLRLVGLREAVRAEGPRSRARLLDERLDELSGLLADAADPALAGGGRALFVTLSDGRVREVVARRSMGDEVVLEDTAYLMPMLVAIADEEPAGVVAVSKDGVRALEVRGDEAEEVLREDYGIPAEDWRPMVGPATTAPGHQAESESQRDLFARRLEEHRRQRIAEIGAAVWQEAGRRGWRRLLAAGAPALVAPLEAARPHDGPELVRSGRLLAATLTPQEVRRVAEEPLAAARSRADRALAERVRDAALSAAGLAAVGMGDVLTALAEGRVQHLLIDPRRRPSGARAPDGRLAVAGEVPPGAGATTPEPHLAERMLERALATGARVTAIAGPAAEPLEAHDGVAAALRW